MLTALRMVEEMDSGLVYAKMPITLEGHVEDIYLRVSELCWEMIFQIINEQSEATPRIGKSTILVR